MPLHYGSLNALCGVLVLVVDAACPSGRIREAISVLLANSLDKFTCHFRIFLQNLWQFFVDAFQ